MKNNFINPIFLSTDDQSTEFTNTDSIQDTIQYINWFYNFILIATGDEKDSKVNLKSLYQKVAKYYDKTRGGDNYKSWMIRILMNQFREKVRKGKDYQEYNIFIENKLNYLITLPENVLNKNLFNLDEISEELLFTSLQKLPLEIKLPFIFNDVLDFNYDETSVYNDIPVGVAAFRIYCARKFLFDNSIRSQLIKDVHYNKNLMINYADRLYIASTSDNEKIERVGLLIDSASSLKEFKSEIFVQNSISNIFKSVYKTKEAPGNLHSRIVKKLRKLS